MRKYTKVGVVVLISIFLTTIGYSQRPSTMVDGSCDNGYSGAITIELQHSTTTYPLPYTASYYNKTTGDYGEFVISDMITLIENLNPGEYLFQIQTSETNIMEFCDVIEMADCSLELTSDEYIIVSNCTAGNGMITLSIDGTGFDFQWTGPDGYTSQSKDISGLSPGEYCITGTDHVTLCTCIDQCFTIEYGPLFNINKDFYSSSTSDKKNLTLSVSDFVNLAPSKNIEPTKPIKNKNVKEINPEVYMSVSPNPFTDDISVEISTNKLLNGEIKVYDINGRIVYKYELNEFNLTTHISLSNLNINPGIYYIHFVYSSGELTLPIVKME